MNQKPRVQCAAYPKEKGIPPVRNGMVVFLYPKTRKDKYVQGRITGTDHKMQGNAE